MVSVKTAVIPETHYSEYIVHIIETMIHLLVSIFSFFYIHICVMATGVMWDLSFSGIQVLQ